ncbi:hypothetical protein SeMB42_g04475 [Synchytrium endobioticum]|uniref:Uncharacterized protein n=1 Tax=Synchytrium endobioticum TaxID=286115 RepID=A0A507CXW3_9FUNG|nr:hypothetical protein SeMB42_g04475 [Synchytrium endobioticum]TPX44864.1 hypothetical protein SeLEV6574_g04241 [Synchytrium endobioticum]
MEVHTETTPDSTKQRRSASPERPKSFYGPSSPRPRSVVGTQPLLAPPSSSPPAPAPVVKIRDFAYPSADPRHICARGLKSPDTIHETHDDEDDDGVDLDPILPALTKALAPVSHPNAPLHFYRAKGVFDFERVTEWEASIKEGEEIVVAHVPSRNATGSDTGANDTGVSVKTDPQPQDFSEHIRQYVEYQTTYGDGWVTGIRVKVQSVDSNNNNNNVATASSVVVKLEDVGLLPDNYLKKL